MMTIEGDETEEHLLVVFEERLKSNIDVWTFENELKEKVF